jgi:hypothetical protein
MVNEGRGRLFRRKDAKFLIYVPKDLAEDSMFPFKDAELSLRENRQVGRQQTPNRKMERTASRKTDIAPAPRTGISDKLECVLRL